jgi:PAS domain-containing protein
MNPPGPANGGAVSQNEIEVILTQHLASCLAMPIFLVDNQGDLLFYNEHAEPILGQRFDETGKMSAEDWGSHFEPFDEERNPIPLEELPLAIALREKRPAHGRIGIKGLDGVERRIDIMGLPLIGQGDRHLGAFAIFWEVDD